MIYGVATLSLCVITGKFIGGIIGALTGIGADVGGVGFAMVLLLILTNTKAFKQLDDRAHDGIGFWQGMYIPVVVAMSATQNVYQALSSGIFAVLAGVAAVAGAFLLLPVLDRTGARRSSGSQATPYMGAGR